MQNFSQKTSTEEEGGQLRELLFQLDLKIYLTQDSVEFRMLWTRYWTVLFIKDGWATIRVLCCRVLVGTATEPHNQYLTSVLLRSIGGIRLQISLVITIECHFIAAMLSSPAPTQLHCNISFCRLFRVVPVKTRISWLSNDDAAAYVTIWYRRAFWDVSDVIF
jgi:hypothetical protein